MSRQDDMNRTPDERQALEALRSLPKPRPSAEARERARAAFLAAEPPVSAPVRRPGRSFWVPLAAAAVLLVAALGAWNYIDTPRGTWTVTDVVNADGVTNAPATGDMIPSGTFATAPESELEMQLGRELRFRMLGGARIEVPEAPRRIWPGEIVIAVHEGEVFGTTGGQKLDVPVRIIAAEAEAVITGTTFAVFQDSTGTCVCMWTGSVVVTSRHDGNVFTLVPETKFYIYPDGSTSGALPLDGMERMKLQMMEDAGILELGD